MTFAPNNLLNLQQYLKEKTGLPYVSLGIVGDTKHVRGYHLGKDRIFSRDGLGNLDYSVQHKRDKEGLTDAASAMDIGNFSELRIMSKWLVTECRNGAADTRDIREIIYSPDGERVLRWDRVRGIDSAPQQGEADNSHLTHTHISWFRDARGSDITGPFKRFFEESQLQKFLIKGRRIGTVTITRNADMVNLLTGEKRGMVPGYTRGVFVEIDRGDGVPGWLTSLNEEPYYFRQSAGQFEPNETPSVDDGYNQAITDAVEILRGMTR